MVVLANYSHYLSAHCAHVMKPDFDKETQFLSEHGRRAVESKKTKYEACFTDQSREESFDARVDTPLWSQTLCSKQRSNVGSHAFTGNLQMIALLFKNRWDVQTS